MMLIYLAKILNESIDFLNFTNSGFLKISKIMKTRKAFFNLKSNLFF